MWVYLNDKFVPEEEATVSIFDYGFLYGDGLFETFRSYSGKIFAIDLHLNRLLTSAKRLDLPTPPPPFLKNKLQETLERNALQDAILRLTVTRGQGSGGFHPELCRHSTVAITVRPLIDYQDLYLKGVSATISSVRRVSSDLEMPCLKSLSFQDNILARIEANKKSVFEGIFLNLNGFITEGSISNLFWVRRQLVHTPSILSPILNGITREILIDQANLNGHIVEEGLYPPDALFEADEAFLTNTAFEVMPLIAVDRKKIGSGLPGPITLKFHRMYKDVVNA